MRKAIIPVVLVLLVAISGLVYANHVPGEPDPVSNEVLKSKDIIYGSTSEKPYMRSIFILHKGWNLIPNPDGEGIPGPTATKSIYEGFPEWVRGCGTKENDNSGYQVKYRYAHISTIGYIGGEVGPNTEFGDPLNQEYGAAWRNFYTTDNFGDFLGLLISFSSTSQWVYSEMDCAYPLATFGLENDLPELKNNLVKTKLNEGWNLFYFTPGFYGDSFGDLIGECNIEKINFWDSLNQNWLYSSTESQQQVSTILNTDINEDNLYIPVVIKVSESCTLGSSGGTVPPSIPN